MKPVYFLIEMGISTVIMSNLLKVSELILPILTCLGIIFAIASITLALDFSRKAIWNKWKP